VPQEIGDFESHFEKSTETRLKISIARHQLSLSSPDFDYEIFPVDLGVFDAGTDTLSSHNANSLNFEMTLAPQISEPPREIRFLLKANSQRPDQEDVALEFKSSLQTMSSQASKEAPKISWLWALVGAFLGGLLLNLMPCVLPVLSLKAFSLVKQSASPSVKWEGLAYSAGVMLSFLSLAILLLLLRSGGEALGWGFQLQNPVFVIAMAWLFVILALQFFEVFEMGESLQNWVGRSGSSQKKGLGTSFLSGVLATLIASPCTAPFMGSAIGFALTLPTVPSLLIFTLLGFGMALPILLLSFFPKTLRLLPTPGAWMNRFKQFMGFPMLATSFWLLWVYGKQTDGDAVIRFLFSSLSLALTLWILGQFKSQWKRHLSVLLSLTLTLWLAWPLIFTQNSKARSSTQQSTQDYSGIPYENFSANKRDEALRQGRPVYVDFTATWCLLCQVNKRVVFPEAQVQELFRSKNILLLKADWTDKNESLLRELESFGRSGVPLNVYYDPKSSKPIVLPSVLRPQSVVDAISQTSP
jgi:thiol:disulfide interchange protein DsbD